MRRLKELKAPSTTPAEMLLTFECCLSHTTTASNSNGKAYDPIRDQVERWDLAQRARGATDNTQSPSPMQTQRTLVSVPAAFVQIAKSITDSGASLEYLAVGDNEDLFRLTLDHAGELFAAEPPSHFSVSRLRKWLRCCPRSLANIRGPGSINEFQESIRGLGLSSLGKGSPVIFLTDALISRLPHHLLLANADSFRVTRPCTSVPSLSWLSSSMASKLQTNGRAIAWVLPYDPESISPTQILQETLNEIAPAANLLIVNGPTVPNGLDKAELAILVAHGGLGLGNRFLVSVVGEDGTQFTPWGAAENLRGARVVVLLVCSAGRSDVEHFSNRTIGLHVEFLNRGTRAVVACPWSIQATSAASWVRYFLVAWTRGAMIADCVHEANEILSELHEPADYLAMHLYGDPFQKRESPQL